MNLAAPGMEGRRERLRSAMREVALVYVSHDWAVFPCRGKEPLTRRGFKDATLKPDQIRIWWQRWPDANIGVATGAASGIAVVDLDTREAEDAFDSLMPAGFVTRAAVTGGGGMHFFFATGRHRVRCRAGRIDRDRLVPGFDVKGDGGYVIVPPSLHSSGERYAWLEPHSLARWPDELIPADPNPSVDDSHLTARAILTRGTGRRYAEAALEDEVRKVRAAANGTRNTTLNAAVFNVWRFVRSGELDADVVVREFAFATSRWGSDERRKAERTIQSAIDGRERDG